MYDSLTAIFDMQAAAQTEHFGGHPADLPAETRIQFIKDMVLAAEDELHEALAEVGWKPWATTRHINREAFIGELVDVQHFIINLLLAAGCDAHEFFIRFEEKNRRNRQRQVDGYDGIAGKCPVCNRALDDKGVLCSRLVGCIGTELYQVTGDATPWPVTA